MRLQVLHLPAPADEHPFALVIDEVSEHQVETLVAADTDDLAGSIGARSVLMFADTVEIV